MSISQPLVSIITPVFNGAEFLEQLLASVQHQDYPNIEHIVINDGSTDNGATVAILEQHSHLRWWSRENKGQYATMNEGLHAAQGEWICFISADDLVAPNAIRLAMEAGQKKRCDIVYGKTLFISADGTKREVQNFFKHVPPSLYAYLNGISHCSMYLNRNKLIKYHLDFDESLKLTADYDWIIRLVRANLKFHFINYYLSSVRRHSSQASVLQGEAQKKELDILLNKHSINRSLFNLVSLFYYIRSVGLEIPYILQTGGLEALWQRIRRWYRHKLRRV